MPRFLATKLTRSSIHESHAPYKSAGGAGKVLSMRELVYVSDRKLDQFLLGKPRRRWWNKVDFEGETSLGPFGRVKISRATSVGRVHTPTLDEVIDALNQSDRAPRWYENEKITAGDWIHFEAKLNYRLLDHERFESVVLFLDVQPLRHGGADHLRGRTLEAWAPELKEYVHRSEESIFEKIAESHWFRDRVRALSEQLHHNSIDFEPSPVAANTKRYGWSSDIMWSIVWSLDTQMIPATAAWMTGYARVTAIVNGQGWDNARIVVASPLYVEYCSAPDTDVV
jgi:hypothetical protein